MLLAKSKLNTIEFFISKAITESYINHHEFVAVNNVQQKFNEIKNEIKNPKNAVEYAI